ncbi:MATE family efflux transporter [Lentisphaera marina]|uniref:MATE family efflux transporter n=1 Tax=Lentisphaera marina TaxID=1111041 RepID=UPI00236515A5|nr:MATE family efflux transporter [Lentisphaera marina]MDD7984437.1 MATE family efflux transporter [Lentisphaera marina]
MYFQNFIEAQKRSWRGPGGIKALLIQATPIIITQSSDTILMFTDRYLLAGKSPIDMAAALSGGLTSFLSVTLFFGLLSQVNALCGQFTGKKSHTEAGLAAGQGILLACFFAPFLFLTLPFARDFFAFCGHSGRLLKLETQYYQILVSAHIITLLRCVLASFFSGIGKPMIIMKSALIGVLINIPLTYALIFGKWNLPELGIVGAAWATVISSFIVLCILIYYYFSHTYRDSHKTHLSIRYNRNIMKALLKLGLPAGIEFTLQLSGFNFFILIFASAGPVAAAAITITFSWELLSYLPMTGIQIAVIALSAKYIGMGKTKLAERTSYNALKIAMLYSGTLAIIFFTFAPELAKIFTNGEINETSQMASTMLRIACIYMTFDAIHLVYAGVLKGAGDLIYPTCLTFVIFWGACVLAYIEINILGMHPIDVWSTFTVLIILIGILYYRRFRTGIWKTKKIIH